MAHQTGKVNIPYGPKLLNFFVAIHASDPKTSEIIRANLHGPGTRYLRRVNSKSREPPFIECERDNLKRSFKAVLKILSDNGVKNPSFTAAIDGTAVVPLLEYSKAHGCIIGGVYPHHMVELDDQTGPLDDCCIETVKEVKCVVISFQQLPKGLPQFWLLNGRPQGKNETSDYNTFVCDILDDPSTTDKYPAVLLNATVDRVSCDTIFVEQSICNFLEGKRDG